jgi:hypothetical protein
MSATDITVTEAAASWLKREHKKLERSTFKEHRTHFTSCRRFADAGAIVGVITSFRTRLMKRCSPTTAGKVLGTLRRTLEAVETSMSLDARAG